uniref:Uncharacterized protein n=1 Tax=Rhizophora mucronata TaxID=61149 RepID=A0A2P2QBB9_RHIMU
MITIKKCKILNFLGNYLSNMCPLVK